MCLPFFAAGARGTCSACGTQNILWNKVCKVRRVLGIPPLSPQIDDQRQWVLGAHVQYCWCNRSSCRAIATIAGVHWETFSHDLSYLSRAVTCKSMRMSRKCEMLQYISLRRSLAATLQAYETANAMTTSVSYQQHSLPTRQPLLITPRSLRFLHYTVLYMASFQ